MSEKLWGGRFSTDITDDVLRYTETAGRAAVHYLSLKLNDCWDTVNDIVVFLREHFTPVVSIEQLKPIDETVEPYG